jgi:hypothetical protein
MSTYMFWRKIVQHEYFFDEINKNNKYSILLLNMKYIMSLLVTNWLTSCVQSINLDYISERNKLSKTELVLSKY